MISSGSMGWKCFMTKMSGSELSALSKAPLLIKEMTDDPSYDKLLCELWRVANDGQARLIIIESLDAIARGAFFNTGQSPGYRTVLGGLKWIASQTNTAFIITCPVNRSPEMRLDHTPQLSDLRGGKRLADYVQTCFMLYRDSYYNIPVTPDNLSVYIVRPNGRRLAPVNFEFRPTECLLFEEWESYSHTDYIPAEDEEAEEAEDETDEEE